jgi:ABC-type Fe3+/spermidine/putrescine transport system ATPase subunit
VANLIADDAGTLAIRPEHVRIDTGAGSPGTVLGAHYAGDHVRVIVDCDGRRIQAHVAPHTAPHAGQEVDVELPAEHVWRLPSSVPAADETA